MNSYKDLIHKFIDWQLICLRLRQYPAISRHFPEETLRNCSDAPPYYCHFMSWRLGTWPGEEAFNFLEKMLNTAMSLPSWEKEFQSWQNRADFGEFWSLLWQMQVAHFFVSHGAKVEWNDDGPDLTITVENTKSFVECYTYRKSYGIGEFIGELFYLIDRRIRVKRTSYLPFNLPNNQATSSFFEELFKPFHDENFVQQEVLKAEKGWPSYLPLPAGAKNYNIYFEGPIEARISGVNAAGCPSLFVQNCLNEAVNAKRKQNNLANNRPNLLAVNYLFGEMSMAEQVMSALNETLPSIDFGDELDAVLMSSTGITKELELFKIVRKSANHPTVDWIGSKVSWGATNT